MNQQTTPLVGATTPTNTRFNPLTRSDIDKQLKRMEYGGAIERVTLINKLIDTQHINRGAAAMQVQRLITKGTLVVNGRMVQLPNITKSRNHAITGGGGCVITVIKCDTESEESEESEEEKEPLWQRVGDMFPEVKPQQSMAAWDDDTPF